MRGPFAEDFAEERDGYIQGVIDLRRSLDLLESLPHCDGGRLAYVGHSIGAQFGAMLASLEKRIKAMVLVGGVPATEDIYLKSDDPDMIQLRENMKEKVDEYIQTLRAVDAIQYIPHAAPVPLFFQFAEFERYFDEASMKRYFEAASEPKEMKWYPTGHELHDIRALIDRAEWLRDKIGMGSVVPILRRILP